LCGNGKQSEPAFCGFVSDCRRVSCRPPAVRALTASTVRYAFSQASSSVGAMIGRNATWILGTSVRPAARAAARTDSICSAVCASG
jgi:hypothetical protein